MQAGIAACLIPYMPRCFSVNSYEYVPSFGGADSRMDSELKNGDVRVLFKSF